MKPIIKYIILAVFIFLAGFLFRKLGLIDFFQPKAEISFVNDDVKKFGDLNEGEEAVHYFKFQNIGNKELIISNIETKCGCTTPDWPKKPIKPNAIDSIRVEYDTHIIGPFNRSIAIYTNTKEKLEYVHIMGIVKD